MNSNVHGIMKFTCSDNITHVSFMYNGDCSEYQHAIPYFKYDVHIVYNDVIQERDSRVYVHIPLKTNVITDMMGVKTQYINTPLSKNFKCVYANNTYIHQPYVNEYRFHYQNKCMNGYIVTQSMPTMKQNNIDKINSIQKSIYNMTQSLHIINESLKNHKQFIDTLCNDESIYDSQKIHFIENEKSSFQLTEIESYVNNISVLQPVCVSQKDLHTTCEITEGQECIINSIPLFQLTRCSHDNIEWANVTLPYSASQFTIHFAPMINYEDSVSSLLFVPGIRKIEPCSMCWHRSHSVISPYDNESIHNEARISTHAMKDEYEDGDKIFIYNAFMVYCKSKTERYLDEMYRVKVIKETKYSYSFYLTKEVITEKIKHYGFDPCMEYFVLNEKHMNLQFKLSKLKYALHHSIFYEFFECTEEQLDLLNIFIEKGQGYCMPKTICFCLNKKFKLKQNASAPQMRKIINEWVSKKRFMIQNESIVISAIDSKRNSLQFIQDIHSISTAIKQWYAQNCIYFC